MSNGLSLYKMTDDFERYLNAETDEEIAGALAEITAGQIEVKIESCCKFLANLEGFAETAKAEADRINKIANSAANKAKRLKEYMKMCLLNADIMKVSAGTFTVSIQQNPAKLEEIDREKCPASYRIIIPETWEPDKSAIKAWIKSGGTVPGYGLSAGQSLRIK